MESLIQITPEILQEYLSHKIISTSNEETDAIAEVLTAFFGEVGNDPSNVVIKDYIPLETTNIIKSDASNKIMSNKVGRNDPCPCGRLFNGSVLKYKKCCGR